jgi:predicted DNA-binding transcriptional regulator YafY
MRRADRLFEIVQMLRGRRLTTAAQLARWLEVSERTIYRDVADLLATGVPIEGEAGMGYRIAAHFDLPPLMFTRNEIEALTMGARVVESWGGPSLAQGARAALGKIASALPPDKRATLEAAPLFAPDIGVDGRCTAWIDAVRAAIAARRWIQVDYHDVGGAATQRRLRPLGLYFWGDCWSLAARCELRQDFRSFRLDRITALHTFDERYPDEQGKRLRDFLRAVGAGE